jgi:hypothetical protein
VLLFREGVAPMSAANRLTVNQAARIFGPHVTAKANVAPSSKSGAITRWIWAAARWQTMRTSKPSWTAALRPGSAQKEKRPPAPGSVPAVRRTLEERLVLQIGCASRASRAGSSRTFQPPTACGDWVRACELPPIVTVGGIAPQVLPRERRAAEVQDIEVRGNRAPGRHRNRHDRDPLIASDPVFPSSVRWMLLCTRRFDPIGEETQSGRRPEPVVDALIAGAR